MMAMMGHGSAVQAIVALVLSTAFLVWLGGKAGTPFQKFGVVIAWIAIVLSALLVICSAVTCVKHCSKYGTPCMRGGMMEEMMEKGGMPMMMGPGMKMQHGMGPMGEPPPPPEKK